MHNTHLIVFAKAPVPGHVKTRLAKVLGDEAAARLAERMLNETLARAATTNPKTLELCCAPDASHPALVRAAERCNATLTVQIGADLGARMAAAFERALQHASCVVLIGTDCPALDAAVMRTAADVLAHGNDAVFVPARDGGYVLIGLTRTHPDLFRDIPWSTAHVMESTAQRLAQLKWTWRALAPLADIDEPRDLELIPKEWLS